MFLEGTVVEPVLRHDHRSDIAALQRAGNDPCLLIGIGNIGYDEHKAAAVFRFGHQVFPFPREFLVEMRDPHSFCVSSSVRRGLQEEDVESMWLTRKR